MKKFWQGFWFMLKWYLVCGLVIGTIILATQVLAGFPIWGTVVFAVLLICTLAGIANAKEWFK